MQIPSTLRTREPEHFSTHRERDFQMNIPNASNFHTPKLLDEDSRFQQFESNLLVSEVAKFWIGFKES